MSGVADQLPEIEEKIMAGLKDFQRATVERIAELYRANQMRVLVSDEVGLGKTLIARGTIAKLAQMRKGENDNLVKVVYVCSNAAIADQNLNKLRISQNVRKEEVSYSRLSMQHLNIFLQENDPELLNSYIQLIPLTPETSFRMTGGAGTVKERALMYAILRRLPALSGHLPALETAMKDSAYASWDSWAKELYECRVCECDKKSDGEYLKFMTAQITRELEEELEPGVTLLSAVLSMCRAIEKDPMARRNNSNVIRKLRIAFAKISLNKLEPDLVIMDEFQRFRYLLNADPESETGLLAEKFFNAESVRMLLLSATPYKMYSTLEEIDETQTDEHYSEFLDVMRFLNVTEEADAHFRTVWNNFSVQLKEISRSGTTLLTAKKSAEDAMYKHVCRTERISESENADLIDDRDKNVPLKITEADIRSYLAAQKLIDAMDAPFHVPIDYIKSSPFLLSFMDNYQLKRNVEKYFREHPNEVGKAKNALLWIDRKQLDHYKKIPNNNARLDRLMGLVFQSNEELLLWVPPAKPYYPFQGAYRNKEGFSKTLLFSSWEMVPRMVSSLVSYEAERRSIGRLANAEREVRYFSADRYPSERLKFSGSGEEARGMPLFCLLYPSEFLASCYDPIACMNQNFSLRQIEREIRAKIAENLAQYSAPSSGRPDSRWYYLAPLLLDNREYASEWLGRDEELQRFEEEEDENENSRSTSWEGFQKYLKVLRERYKEAEAESCIALGKRPDDLLDVLTDMAIASPAICMKRTYDYYTSERTRVDSALPSQIAKLFINLMNTPEATATVELACGRKSEDAHWKNVLTYCKEGNLQAMLDEYAHILSNGLDDDAYLVEKLHSTIINSMNLRPAGYKADTYPAFVKRISGRKEGKNKTTIRTHFAVAFAKGEGGEKDANRKKAVRDAFNSPFRPFILASTSIGQEGLDFHNYCRRIVHWNLPSNPIDLEQREGRINRFECLAIRQNVAKRYGGIQFHRDVWKELFDEAKRVEKADGCSDLIPYWGLQESEDMVRIERIVPMYPFSRDETMYERLIKILSLYRLTLGQPRQEELLEYIFQNCDNTEHLRDMFINLSPYYRHMTENTPDNKCADHPD